MTPELDAPSQLDARRILVVAPHPDDESLGCGGLIAVLSRLGRRFHVVFVTDGGASHLGSKTWPRARLAAQREAEATEALRQLGLGDHPRSFLRLQDADMPKPGTAQDDAAMATLAALLLEFKPDLVLLPWRRDPHRDHRDAWSLTKRALSAAEQNPETLEYAIWLDEIGGADDRPMIGEADRVAFDIAAVLAVKQAATHAHLSQITRLIDDDPAAFRLTPHTIDRLTGPVEVYWRPR